MVVCNNNVTFRTYTAERLPVVGEMHVHVQTSDLPLLVVRGDGPALLGRDWSQHIHLDWARIVYSMTSFGALPSLLKRYQDIFKDELGTVKDVTAQLMLMSDASSKLSPPQCTLCLPGC